MSIRTFPVALAVLALCAEAPAQRVSDPGTSSWRIWWELNREELVGYRLAARKLVGGSEAGVDFLGTHRARVLDALREIAIAGDRSAGGALAIREAGKGNRPTLRVAVIVALGRMGEDRDAHLLLGLAEDAEERGAVRQAAALALGLLPPLTDPAARTRMEEELGRYVTVRRDVFKDSEAFGIVTVRKVLPTLARNLAFLAGGLRAREDHGIMMHLARSAGSGVKTQQEAQALALALGLSGQDFLLPELARAAQGQPFAGKELEDVGRSYVAHALARMEDPTTAEALVELLRAEGSGIQTRRAAALALGRLLRKGVLGGEGARMARGALAAAMKGSGRVVTRGFSATALGAASEAASVKDLAEALDRGKDPEFRCFAVVALGLAARNSGEQQAAWIRSLLVRALDKAGHVQVEAALCLALGLARAREGLDPLAARARKRSAGTGVRRAALEGLGLVRSHSPKAEQAVLAALKEPRIELTEDAAVALGMLGRQDVTRLLLAMLADARGSGTRNRLRTRLLAALGRVGTPVAAGALLRELLDTSAELDRREAAAFSLGQLGDPRREDVLAGLLADFNPYARSATVEELTRLSGLRSSEESVPR